MAKDRYEIDFSSDPTFNTVIGLSNTTFDINNVRSGYMATEDQISQLYADIVRNEKRRDECCRDIIVWEAHTQIVRMNTLNIISTLLQGGGVVVSTFDENVSIGTMRRGLSYTVTFPIKWNDNLYVKRNVSTNSTNCSIFQTIVDRTHVNYRIVEDETIEVCESQVTSNNYARFWIEGGKPVNSGGQLNNNKMGHIINPGSNWASFIHDIKDDGTVTITDHRRNTNFNIIRFYTQWVLRRTADNQMIPDPE